MRVRDPWRSLPPVLCIALCSLTSVACFPPDAGPADDFVGPAREAAAGAETRAAKPARPAPPPPAAKAAPAGPLKLGVQQAIIVAMANNKALKVERLNPLILRTFEGQERAVFDPVLGAELSRSKTRSQRLARAGAGTESSASRATSAGASLDQLFPTGTSVGLSAGTDVTESSLYVEKLAASRLGLTVTQALLEGRGVAVNLASLRQARLDTLGSDYELRGFAETLVADVEQTCWDYALAKRQIDIFTQSLKLAEQQRRETLERIRIGKLAETEVAAAEAEVARRREALINARSDLAKTRLRLLHLLNPPGGGLWQRSIELQEQPAVPDSALDDVESHVAVALRMRPDLNQTRLQVSRGDLELVKTKNGLLPKLDLFITLGKTGYSNSFGPSWRDVDGEAYDIAGGLALEYALGNRGPRALHERAVLSRRQAEEAVDNLIQLVQVDVRSAYLEVQRAREQVSATAATSKFQEETLRAETEKFRVGKSTTLLVAQAQRDLVASQIAEVEAVVTLLKGLVDLYRLEGSLLDRRGIEAPGRRPANTHTMGR